MSKILKIAKTRYSKIALNLFLIDKANMNTLEEYIELFNKLAIILFKIDCCETQKELFEKVEEGILFPVGTDEHEQILRDDIDLFCSRLLRIHNDFDGNEPIYTNDDVCNNLDKFKFL